MQREKQELQAKVADYQTPEWAKVEDDLDSELEDDEEEQEEEVNEFYCVVCDKGYKSEKQFASHESSKRHIDNVEILRQEMLADEENFDFGNATPSMDDLDGGIPVDEEDLAAQLDELELLQQQQEEEEVIHVAPSSNKKKKKKNKAKMAPNWGFDEEAVPEEMDEMAMLAAALEEEKSKRRGRKGNNRASSPAPPNQVDLADTHDTQEKEAPVSVEKESAKTKREKRKEKKKLKEENATSEVSFLYPQKYGVFWPFNRMRAMSVAINSKLEISFLDISMKPATLWRSLDQKAGTRKEIKDVDFIEKRRFYDLVRLIYYREPLSTVYYVWALRINSEKPCSSTKRTVRQSRFLSWKEGFTSQVKNTFSKCIYHENLSSVCT